MKSTNYRATILHKSNDGKFLVIGTEDGELFAFDLYNSLQIRVNPNLSSYTLPKLKNEDFSSSATINFEQETVDLKLFGLSVKVPLFRLGWSKLKKIWLVSDEIL